MKLKFESNINFVIVFIIGICFSVLIYSIIYCGNVSVKLSYHIPKENYLQVRDEYSIIGNEVIHYYHQHYYQQSSDPVAASHQQSIGGTGGGDDSTNQENQIYDLDISRHISRKKKNKHYGKNEDQQEALSSLKVAVEMCALGKTDKASKLFKHALALAPKHPEVLTKYGEFFENKRDIVMADRLYVQALSINPNHGQALVNRQRTATIVDVIDAKRLKKLDEKRDTLSVINESNAAFRRVAKEAYFQNIYHSVGIEGNTMTLAQTRSILETRMAVDGKSIDEHNEILGLDAAMKYINASLANKNDYITLKDILEIHKRVLGHVDPIEGGEFRRTQVYVGGHIPPAPNNLMILMQRFEQWLNSKDTLNLHPVKYAALAHYKLVHIHPFVDGNGRTSRLLMNTILMRAGYPPVIIPKQQRYKYYEYLQIANEGDIRPFIRFIADCTDLTLDLFLWATSELSHQIPMLTKLSNEVLPILDSDEETDDDDNIENTDNKKQFSDNSNNNYEDEINGSGDAVRLGGLTN